MKLEMLKFLGIRKKLIVYFLTTIALLGLTSVFSLYNSRVVLKNTDNIITGYAYLNNLNNDVNGLMTELEKYMTTTSSENLLNYYTFYNNLQRTSGQIPRAANYNYDMLLMKDIGNMIDELLIETDNAVRAKRGRISSRYISYFQRSNEISEYIKLYNNKLLDSKLRSGSERYEGINRSMSYLMFLNLFIIIAVVLVNLYIAVSSTYRLTKPITELSHSAEKIAEGNFDIEVPQTHTGDETDILAGAFIKMANSVRDYIEGLKSQAEVEKRLKEQEMQNLKMVSLLKDAELKFLQSQINPHFLFNTLNAASQLAMMEGADKSSEFMGNIAHIFRYNLKNIDELVALREEIKYVKNYMQILKIRFGSRIEYFEDIQKDALDILIPRITVQPIVENAYIHGLQNLERDGEIHLNVRKDEQHTIIEIIDNGMGMDEDRIQALLNLNEDIGVEKKHITGIGISNVMQRLKILYNVEDPRELISIESKLEAGTKVTLKLPLTVKINSKEVESSAEAVDS